MNGLFTRGHSCPRLNAPVGRNRSTHFIPQSLRKPCFGLRSAVSLLAWHAVSIFLAPEVLRKNEVVSHGNPHAFRYGTQGR
jgi:hypothetical protein